MVKICILRLIIISLMIVSSGGMSQPSSDWFDDFKDEATPEQLYNFLYLLPKGGDLHNHLGGANFSEWWFELATRPEKNGGYRY
ncbi:MAG: adenosine deaminase, partial [Paraglaciecola sp.]|nr:adenosine deaminase [Paraglaciecola sp.]